MSLVYYAVPSTLDVGTSCENRTKEIEDKKTLSDLVLKPKRGKQIIL